MNRTKVKDDLWVTNNVVRIHVVKYNSRSTFVSLYTSSRPLILEWTWPCQPFPKSLLPRNSTKVYYPSCTSSTLPSVLGQSITVFVFKSTFFLLLFILSSLERLRHSGHNRSIILVRFYSVLFLRCLVIGNTVICVFRNSFLIIGLRLLYILPNSLYWFTLNRVLTFQPNCIFSVSYIIWYNYFISYFWCTTRVICTFFRKSF